MSGPYQATDDGWHQLDDMVLTVSVTPAPRLVVMVNSPHLPAPRAIAVESAVGVAIVQEHLRLAIAAANFYRVK